MIFQISLRLWKAHDFYDFHNFQSANVKFLPIELQQKRTQFQGFLTIFLDFPIFCSYFQYLLTTCLLLQDSPIWLSLAPCSDVLALVVLGYTDGKKTVRTQSTAKYRYAKSKTKALAYSPRLFVQQSFISSIIILIGTYMMATTIIVSIIVLVFRNQRQYQFRAFCIVNAF